MISPPNDTVDGGNILYRGPLGRRRGNGFYLAFAKAI